MSSFLIIKNKQKQKRRSRVIYCRDRCAGSTESNRERISSFDKKKIFKNILFVFCAYFYNNF